MARTGRCASCVDHRFIHVEIRQRRRGFQEIFEIGWVAFAWQFAGEREAHFERQNTEGPSERAPPGPCLSAVRLPGAEVGSYDRARSIALGAAANNRRGDHVIGIATQIPKMQRGRHADTDETRAARFAPGTYPSNLR